MPETIREFVLGLTFGKPDEKNLDKATASAKKAATDQQAAYKAAAKEVEKAQEAVRTASDKTAKKIAQDALHAARQQAKAAKEAAKEAVASFKRIEKAGHDAAKAQAKSIKDQDALLGKLKGGAGAVVAALGVGGIAAVTSDILEQATAVREWTARLGDAPEVIQEVAGAAKILGVDMEVALKSVQKLRVGIGEGTANEPLKAIGLDANALAGMDAKGQLRAIADGLATVGSDAERTAIAVRLFGEEGGRLVPVLAGGATGFDELTRAAVEAGAVMSGETLQAAQDFDRKLNELIITSKGWAATLLGDVLPAISNVADDVGVLGEAIGVLSDETDDAAEAAEDSEDSWMGLALYLGGPFYQMILMVTTAVGLLADELRTMEDQIAGSALGARMKVAADVAAAQRDIMVSNDLIGQSAVAAANVHVQESVRLGKIAGDQKGKKTGRGGGGRKKTEIEFQAEDFEADELFGDEIRRLGEQAGVGQIAIDEAIKAGGSSIKSGDVESEARKAALSRLSQSSGVDYSSKGSSDPLLSAIFGENVPDVELSKMALGATPQTLIATINNNFAMQFDIAVDGAGNPADVAAEVHTQSQALWKDKVAATTKLVKPAFHR